jgi:uncharacterized protein
MNCPVCANTLSEIDAGGIRVDVCQDGCGGTWFDWLELQRVDEPDENVAESLLAVPRDYIAELTGDRQHQCPRCEGQPLARHFFSVKREVEVDECPACGGFWLDAGELSAIRNLFDSEDSARKAAREIFGELVDENGAEVRAESRERLDKSRRIAQLFRFICPSYYIPGRQKWGAF